MKKVFMKRYVFVDIDGLRGINKYEVADQFDEIDDDGFGEIKLETIDKFEYTWKEIDEEGGLDKLQSEIIDLYGDVEFTVC